MSTARRPLGVQGRGKNPVTQPAPVGEGAPHRVAREESGSGHLRMGVTADKLAAGRAARALHSEAPALQRLVGLARPLPEPPRPAARLPPTPPPRSAPSGCLGRGRQASRPGKAVRVALGRACDAAPRTGSAARGGGAEGSGDSGRCSPLSFGALTGAASPWKRAHLSCEGAFSGPLCPPKSGSGSEPSGTTNADTVPRAHGPPPWGQPCCPRVPWPPAACPRGKAPDPSSTCPLRSALPPRLRSWRVASRDGPRQERRRLTGPPPGATARNARRMSWQCVRAGGNIS